MFWRPFLFCIGYTVFECVGLMVLCFLSVIYHNQMCNSSEEPSLSDMEINTSSDSSAEPVFLSDASKVICHGPGLSKGFLGRKNTFYVDCSKAGECSLTLARMLSNVSREMSLSELCSCFCVVGRNLLFVGMHGPTVPCERVSIIHMADISTGSTML